MTIPPSQSRFEKNLAAPRRVVLSTAPRAELRVENGRVELLRAANDQPLTRTIDVATHVRLQPGRFRTSLHLAELSVSLSPSQLASALELVALGRATGGSLPKLQPDHWLRHVGDAYLFVGLEELWGVLLCKVLRVDEWPLAWLPTSLELTGHSEELGQWHAQAHYLLTEQRQLLVARSVLGDLEQLVLPDSALEIRRREIEVGTVCWRSSTQLRFGEIRTLGTRSARERMLQVARIERMHRPKDAPAASSLSSTPMFHSMWLEQLLTRASDRGDPRATTLLRIRALERGEPAGDWTPSELEEDLGELSDSWQLGTSRSRLLLASLPREPFAMPAAIALARQLGEQERGNASDLAGVAQADMSQAEVLLEFGRHAEASELLRARRASWPALQLEDLELPANRTPTTLRTVRMRLEQLALRAAPLDTRAQTQALLRLLELDPLNGDWLLRLSEVADAPLRDRASRAHRLLHGPSDGAPPPSDDAPEQSLKAVSAPLSAEDWSLLSHPMVAAQQGLLSRVQTLIAKTDSPDFSTLKLYCERITGENSPVTRAVDRAAMLLGLGHTDVYVSRGHDDVGVRAFTHQSPFLLVGSQHLDPQSRFFMQEPQLLFAISSELAHVRLGHVRVAPKHVLRGALDKGKQGLDLALGVLPILKGFALANRLGMATAKLSLPQVGKAMTAARALSGAVKQDHNKSNGRTDIATANEQLLLAHRLMQLSADRVGLLCCQAPEAAVFSMLLGRSDYVRAATEAPQLGALRAINRQRQGNPQAYDDLLMRLGALTSFYVSDTFALLNHSTYAARL